MSVLNLFRLGGGKELEKYVVRVYSQVYGIETHIWGKLSLCTMQNLLDSLPIPQEVANWSGTEQINWATEYGELLWSVHGDDEIPPTLTQEQRDADKHKAWSVVYDENRTRIDADLETLAKSQQLSAYDLKHAMRRGFFSAYESV